MKWIKHFVTGFISRLETLYATPVRRVGNQGFSPGTPAFSPTYPLDMSNIVGFRKLEMAGFFLHMGNVYLESKIYMF